MRFSASLLVATLFLMLPTASDAQKKGNKTIEDVPMATDEEYAALNTLKEVQGTVMAVDSNTLTRTLTFRVEYKEWAANPKYKPSKVPGNPKAAANYQKTYQRLLQEQQRAMSMTNFNQRQAALNRVQTQFVQLMNQMYMDQSRQSDQAQAAYYRDLQNGNVPFIQVTKHKDAQLDVQDNVKVRRLKLPMEYDDKGFEKEYTKEELDKLHLVDNKDKKLPGYPADYKDVLVGDKVTLGLTSAKKDPPADKKKIDKKDPNGGEDPIKEAVKKPSSNRPTIRLIVLTDESGAMQPGDSPTTPTKRKKN